MHMKGQAGTVHHLCVTVVVTDKALTVLVTFVSNFISVGFDLVPLAVLLVEGQVIIQCRKLCPEL